MEGFNLFLNMKKVMLVDDQEISNFIMRKYIEMCAPEVEVLEFTNPAEALEVVNNEDPDVIFLDLNMPLMTGWDFLDLMLERKMLNKVLVLSSSIDPLDTARVSNYGHVVRFCEKPINREILPDLLNEAQQFKISA